LRLLKAALLLAGLCPLVVPAADEQSGVKVETLLRTSSAWDGVPYEAYPKGPPELSVLRITIAPHSKLKWHTHPMPNGAYMLSGELTVEEPSGNKNQHFVAGQVVPETVNTLHRGVAGDQPVVLIVFYAGVKGMPLAK
jgi:quercetin dioxygenase-like cupin family protein